MILFFHMAEVPVWVRAIQPTVITVSLTPYSTGGELFPNTQTLNMFTMGSWQRWRRVSPEYSTPPHLFVMNLAGISALRVENARWGFAFALSNFVGRSRPTYLAFDNLSFEGEDNPWQSLSQALEDRRRNRVAIARKEGEERYQLIGARQFTEGRHWQDIFSRLVTAGDWVTGKDFVRDSQGLPTIGAKALWQYLHEMSLVGLLLQRTTGGLSYFRVPCLEFKSSIRKIGVGFTADIHGS